MSQNGHYALVVAGESGAQFGGRAFSISVDRVRTVDPPQEHLAAGVIVLHGVDWSLGSVATETLVQVSSRLGDFVKDGNLRHFGAFAELTTPTEAVNHVESYAFGGSGSSSPGIGAVWASSALARYSLSALFDHNLSVRQAISVRTPEHEHLMWTGDDLGTRYVSIPVDTFDAAVREFHSWSIDLTTSA